MKRIRLPVSWEMHATVDIVADSVEEAIQIFHDNIDEFKLPFWSKYVDGSFDLISN